MSDRKTFDLAAIGMALVDTDGRLLDVNRAFCRLTGYSEAELRHKHFQEITHPDDVAGDLAGRNSLLVGAHESYEREKRYLQKEGASIWVLLTVSLVRDTDGHPLYFITQAQDITRRKQAEEALQGRNTLLQQILQLLPVGVWVLDRAGCAMETNTAGRKIWAGVRYAGIEDLGEYRGCWTATGRPVAPEEWGGVRAVKRGQTSIGEMIDIQAFDGTRKTILNSAVPLHDPDGTLAGAIVVNEDITELKKTEQALRESRQLLVERVKQLEAALEEVRTLRGILPICAYCHKIRNDENYWQQLEAYISSHSDVTFTHSICPSCAERVLRDVEGMED